MQLIHKYSHLAGRARQKETFELTQCVKSTTVLRWSSFFFVRSNKNSRCLYQWNLS